MPPAPPGSFGGEGARIGAELSAGTAKEEVAAPENLGSSEVEVEGDVVQCKPGVPQPRAGQTAMLLQLARQGDSDRLGALLRGGDVDSQQLPVALRLAARHGRATVTAQLLAHVSSSQHDGVRRQLVQAHDSDGYNVFHEACFYGHVAVLELLVRAGAEAQVQTRNGMTGFDLCCRNGCVAAARALEALDMADQGREL
eukprot:COSAG05_NODE_9526_length_618_cov_1.042389_1_plen_197_part_01